MSIEQVWLITLVICVGVPFGLRRAGYRLRSCLNFAFAIFGATMLVYGSKSGYVSRFGVFAVIMLAVLEPVRQTPFWPGTSYCFMGK